MMTAGARGRRTVRETSCTSGLSDVEAGNQAILDPEDVTDHLVDQYRSLEVAHRLVDLDDDGLGIGAAREGSRLDARINRRPLSAPIAPHGFTAVNVASLHAIGPRHIGMQRTEHGLDITSIEALVDLSEKHHVVGHPNVSRRVAWEALNGM